MIIYDAIDKYIDYLRFQKGLSEVTLEDYTEDFKSFLYHLPYLKDTNDISIDDISEFTFLLSLDMLKASTIRRRVITIKNFYLFLDREKIIDHLNLAEVELPKLEKKLPTYLTQKEVTRLLNAPDTSLSKGIFEKAVLEVLYSSGLRVSEIINLDIKDIIEEDKLIKVHGKGNKVRIIPIREEALNWVKHYVKNVRSKWNLYDSKRLFITNKGLGLTRQYLYKLVKSLSIKAEIKKEVHPHTLRHSFATHLIENGASVSSVQALLGHKLVSTTQIYTHLSEEKIVAAYDLFWKD